MIIEKWQNRRGINSLAGYHRLVQNVGAYCIRPWQFGTQEINCFSSRETKCFDGSSPMEDLLESNRQRDWQMCDRLLSDRTFQSMIGSYCQKSRYFPATEVEWKTRGKIQCSLGIARG